MCGLTGFFLPGGFNHAEAAAQVVRMRDTLLHRGPDDAGLWLDAEAGFAMAHRRLSILDLSPAGHQPMHSRSGRYVLAFNGEVYNHEELRRRLEGIGPACWRGHSDTETLLAAIDAWGLALALQRAVGMFALAVWDRQDRTLSLARDRMGEKPLYYGWQADTLLFGSELKALRAHPAFRSEVDRDVLPLFLRHGYVPAPWSVWKGIRKLVPGCIVQISSERTGDTPQPRPYWSLADAIAQGKANPFVGSEKDAIDAMEAQLREAIASQMVADVPVGAFLSGGIDSSTVVALMQAQSTRRIKTFTIGFAEAGYNEAEHARAVAAHIGTDHTELRVAAAQARDVIPLLPQLYDEPFGDSSSIPTHLVSQLARQHVKVSLSGDGGDELFGGYTRYQRTERRWQRMRGMPLPLRQWAAAVLRSRAVALVESALQISASRVPPLHGKFIVGRAAHLAGLSGSDSLAEFYTASTSQWSDPPVFGDGPSAHALRNAAPSALVEEPIQQMMAADSLSYLPDDILVKVDRAAMAVGLETRVPLLDHRVIELAWRMPYETKVRGLQGKWLLRQVLDRHVPRALIDRPKMGFGVPVDAWLCGPLREWAEDLLSAHRLRHEGFLDPAPIRARWQQHLDGRRNWRDSLWVVLMWQAWVADNLPS